MLKFYTAILLVSFNANALEYDVDWPPSKDPKYHTLSITIENCETIFKVKLSNLEKFANNDEALKESIDLAMKRYNNGCK